ncbi:nascent polypeptide-associated complex protein [Candidatus Woesearchaeota archaeon]|nr:nascent polypeptide-associated complex protein [Candidatus Woesearchaeota archaeon]
MFPNMNPRQLQAAMKKMGMKQDEIEASEVIIKTKDKNLIIRDPKVSKLNMMGQESFQIVGDVEEENLISDDDIKTVAEQSKVSKAIAKKSLEENKGDLAAAILQLNDE